MSRVVVLVEPENPLNIGFAARAMKCSGLTELRIVSPETTAMDDKAYRTGTSAKEILDEAHFFGSLEQALEDCHYSVGFSRRTFTEAADFCTLAELPPKLPAGTTGFIFGRESQGLFRHELALCSMLCTIQLQNTMSYNLGQAVSVALYETEIRALNEKASSYVRAIQELPQQQPQELRPLPSEGQRQALLKRLSSNESFLAKNDRQVQLRKIVSKLNLTSDELSLLMGALKEPV